MRLSVIKLLSPPAHFLTVALHLQPLKKSFVGFYIGLVCSVSAMATLPEPVEAALANANIASDDISIVITPVKHLAFSTHKSDSNLNQHSLVSVLEPITISETPTPNPQVIQYERITQAKTVAESELSNSEDSNESAVDDDSNHKVNNSIKNNAIKTNPTQTNATENFVNHPQPLSLPIRHLPDMPRTPASTMKLIPTFIALDMLGADFVWLTEVYHTGFIFGNTLYGDLIIKGSGDPKLTYQRLAVLLAKINRSGVRHIKGDIVLDTSIFREVGKDPAAFDNEPLRPYNASPDGLLINFSSIKMTTVPLLASGNSQDKAQLARIFYSPMLSEYQLPSFVPMREGTCSSVIDSLLPSWTTHSLKFQNSMPKSCDARTLYLAYPNVKDFAKKVIRYQWLEMGNTLSGDIISTEHPIKTRFDTYLDMNVNTKFNTPPKAAVMSSSPFPMLTYQSLPLSNQIYDINHYSNNVMTEQLILSLPIYRSLGTANYVHDTASYQTDMNNSQPSKQIAVTPQYSDYSKAIATIDDWWQSTLTTPPPYMTNGSGLCRECTVTADNLAELLEYAYHHPSFDVYVNSLGIAGISGTIKQHADRLPNSAAIGRAWVKTGTLDNVTAMAGYVHGQSGQDYVVVSIINRPEKLNTYQARYALDTLLDWTAKH